MAKRINIFQTFTPTAPGQGAVRRLQQLGGLFGQVSEISSQVLTRQQAELGRKEGQEIQTDETGQIKAPELRSSLTARGQSFNNATVLAYRARISIDAKKELDRIQNENKLDPKAFDNAAKAYMNSTLQSMPDDIRVSAGKDMESSIASRQSQVDRSFFQREERNQQATAQQGIEDATDDILNATREGDTQRASDLIIQQRAMLNGWVESGIVDPVKANQIQEQVAERIAQQTALGDIDRVVFNDNLSLEEKVSKGTSLLQGLKERKLEDLSPEQKDSLVNVMSAKVAGLETQLAEQNARTTIDQERQISNLKVNSRVGLGDPSKLVEETETLFNQELITGNERSSILTDIFKGQGTRKKLAQNDSMVAEKLAGNQRIVLDQNVVDSYYERNVKDRMAGLSLEEANANKALFIDRLKAVPKSIKAEIQNNILSGNPDLIVESAKLVDRIDDIAGVKELAINSNQRAFMNHVQNLTDVIGPEQAVLTARELTDPSNKARVDARKAEIKDEDFEDDYTDTVEDAFEDFIGGTELVKNVNTENITAEYKQTFESLFIAGMDKGVAEEKAIQLLKRNWKESQFGFMKFPPETYYQVGDNVDYIKKQLVKDVSKDFIGVGFESDNLFLLTDDKTSRGAAQGTPDYKVMMIDGNGEIQMLPGRWSPDVRKEQDRQTKENEAAEGKKRAERIGDVEETRIVRLERLN